MMELRPNAPAISIKVDAAPLAARRLLAQMIAAEQPLPLTDAPG